MQIVIDVPEYIYKLCQGHGDIVYKYIANGTPLPKGHGDLVDRDAISERYFAIYDEAMNCSNQPTYKYLLDKLSMCLDDADAIIEADEE